MRRDLIGLDELNSKILVTSFAPKIAFGTLTENSVKNPSDAVVRTFKLWLVKNIFIWPALRP